MEGMLCRPLSYAQVPLLSMMESISLAVGISCPQCCVVTRVCSQRSQRFCEWLRWLHLNARRLSSMKSGLSLRSLAQGTHVPTRRWTDTAWSWPKRGPLATVNSEIAWVGGCTRLSTPRRRSRSRCTSINARPDTSVRTQTLEFEPLSLLLLGRSPWRSLRTFVLPSISISDALRASKWLGTWKSGVSCVDWLHPLQAP